MFFFEAPRLELEPAMMFVQSSGKLLFFLMGNLSMFSGQGCWISGHCCAMFVIYI